MTGFYNGYTTCPLGTGYDKCINAEFVYNFQPVETFPFAQDKERYTMFWMKKHVMPALYWKLMVKGWWSGPEIIRKLLSVFKINKL